MKVYLQQVRNGKYVECPNSDAEEAALERLSRWQTCQDEGDEDIYYLVPDEDIAEFAELARPFEIIKLKKEVKNEQRTN